MRIKGEKVLNMHKIKNRILAFVFFTVVILAATICNGAELPFSRHNGYVVVISDLHHPFFPRNIEAIFKEIVSIKPAHVFMLGDLTEFGKDSEFESLKKSLAVLDTGAIKYNMLLATTIHDGQARLERPKTLAMHCMKITV